MNCPLVTCKKEMIRITSHNLVVIFKCPNPKCHTEVKMSAKLYKKEYPNDKSVEGE